uniref:hypothetical protein n=1 Tax=Paractinoplanes polyasparticus TaxID=2856853 RepID=UPI001C850ED5|nr:hypothetical protein [Actinoplanes polyasparticus]
MNSYLTRTAVGIAAVTALTLVSPAAPALAIGYGSCGGGAAEIHHGDAGTVTQITCVRGTGQLQLNINHTFRLKAANRTTTFAFVSRGVEKIQTFNAGSHINIASPGATTRWIRIH